MVASFTGNPNKVTKFKAKGESHKRTSKKAMRCKDGPYEGHTLYLVNPSTCVFSVGANKGRYVNGHWEEM